MEQRNYLSNQSNSTEQSLNNSTHIPAYTPYKVNNLYYSQNPKFTKNIESPKVIQNKINTQTNTNFSINHQNKKILKSLNNSKQEINSFDGSFYSQKPIQTFELNLNSYNNNINNDINHNINKINNIVNIDNQASAIQLCFLAKKKPKNNYKTSVIYQIGPLQTPLSFTFLAEKPNKLSENNKNLELNINIQNNNNNNSFINNTSFVENDNNYLNVNSRKNELKIMQNPERKNNNLSKPKPVLQIMSNNNSNKNNFSKKLSENNLLQVNAFSLEDNNINNINNLNNDLKNNFAYISKSASMIVGNNNNQDMSFISNSKETENLLDINTINNALSFSQQIENNNSNAYNNFFNVSIIINKQMCFIAKKKKIKEENNINNLNNKSNINKTSAKKYIKFEYYDTQPVYFDIISDKINFENNYKRDIFKINRVEEMHFIVNNNNNKDNKDDNKINENEDKSMEKEENRSLNNSCGNNNKKRRKRKKKK